MPDGRFDHGLVSLLSQAEPEFDAAGMKLLIGVAITTAALCFSFVVLMS